MENSNIKYYVLVQWPESQYLMEHPRFKECIFCQDLDGHEEVGSSAYMVPADLYRELFVEPTEPSNIRNVIKKLEWFLEQAGDLEIREHGEDGKVCARVIDLEIGDKFVDFEVDGDYYTDPDAKPYTISMLLGALREAAEKDKNLTVRSNGESEDGYGWFLYPLEYYTLSENCEYLILEGIDHSLDYTR